MKMKSALAAASLLLLGCSGTTGSSEAPSATPTMKTLTIQLVVGEKSADAPQPYRQKGDPECQANGFGSANQATVKDESGTVIGVVGFTNEATYDEATRQCDWSVSVSVPETSFYTVEVNSTPPDFTNPSGWWECSQWPTGLGGYRDVCYKGFSKSFSAEDLSALGWTVVIS